MRRAGERLTPLAALVAAAVAASCFATLVVAAAVLEATGRARVGIAEVVAAGGPMAAVAAAAGAVVAVRFARVLRVLRADALRRLHDPAAPLDTGASSVPGWAGSELVELARTLDAIHGRVRMADEVADRHRRSAETASAGMFELLCGLVEAEEGARGQLSAELHDTVAQSLMAARARLAADVVDLPEVAELVAEAEEQVRAVMARTRPPALRDGDLARAVEALRDDLMLRYGLDVALDWPAEAYPLPLVTAVTVYRFFQEALLNVVKHADVDEATASLRVDDAWVIAVVHDAGPGFDPAGVSSERGRHVGLGLLRERARLVGGQVDVTSWPEPGTTITLRLPRGAAAGPGLVPVPRFSVA